MQVAGPKWVTLHDYLLLLYEPLTEMSSLNYSTQGYVLIICRAYAPGTGDPSGFTIGDCATQRNLDEQGKVQARKIGNWLRAGGIMSARVYSSQ